MPHEIPPNVTAIVLDGAVTHSLAAVGTPEDRGCPACKRVAAENDALVFDGRGRYWHQRYVVATLTHHTRRDEDRESARYLWHFDRVPPGLIP